MPKIPEDIPNTEITKQGSKDLADKSEDLLHRPTRTQEKMKARFWTRFSPGPMTNLATMTAKDISRIIGNTSVERHWNNLTFREWFLDSSEEREQVKFLFNKGLAALEHILDDPTNNSSSVVNALKLLAELNGNLSKKVVEKYLDDDINKMSVHQLETFLKNQGLDVAHVVTPVEPSKAKDPTNGETDEDK